MNIAALAIGPLLATLAVLLLERSGWRPVAVMILSAVPLALMSLPIAVVTGAYAFISGFAGLAATGSGGAGPVSEVCLKTTTNILVATVTITLLLLFIAFRAMLHHRHGRSSSDAQPSGRVTVWRWTSIVTLSGLPAAGTGIAASAAERLARLAMLAVDPSRRAEADAVLGKLDVSQLSSLLGVTAASETKGCACTHGSSCWRLAVW